MTASKNSRGLSPHSKDPSPNGEGAAAATGGLSPNGGGLSPIGGDRAELPPTHYTPGYVVPKILYLGFGCLIMLFAGWMVGEPASRLLVGQHGEARVREIVRVAPGEADQAFAYRRPFEPETNMAVTFQHYVSVQIDGNPVRYRLGVDSRKQPYANVNDRIRVVYFVDDPQRIAYAPGHARTWGMGILYTVVGLCFVATGIPMLLAARKPIAIDP
jgi:hypothetical protein